LVGLPLVSQLQYLAASFQVTMVAGAFQPTMRDPSFQ